jgi:Transcriptional regulatory protein, C terminal
MRQATPSLRQAENLRFDDFVIDLRAGRLRKNGTEVRLQEQPFQILAQLTQHAGEVVTREELTQQVWPPATFVDFDNSLNTAINKIHRQGLLRRVLSGTLHLGLGRAYALTGDFASARSAYLDFFILWKDADPDTPILKQAKAEYTKLQ